MDPQRVSAPREGRVGVVNDAVLEGEGARARQVPRPLIKLIGRHRWHSAEVVLSRPHELLVGEGNGEVVVEVTAGRGHQQRAPAHPSPERRQLIDRVRQTATIETSWFSRWMVLASKPSVIEAQLGQSGNMKW